MKTIYLLCQDEWEYVLEFLDKLSEWKSILLVNSHFRKVGLAHLTQIPLCNFKLKSNPILANLLIHSNRSQYEMEYILNQFRECQFLVSMIEKLGNEFNPFLFQCAPTIFNYLCDEQKLKKYIQRFDTKECGFDLLKHAIKNLNLKAVSILLENEHIQVSKCENEILLFIINSHWCQKMISIFCLIFTHSSFSYVNTHQIVECLIKTDRIKSLKFIYSYDYIKTHILPFYFTDLHVTTLVQYIPHLSFDQQHYCLKSSINQNLFDITRKVLKNPELKTSGRQNLMLKSIVFSQEFVELWFCHPNTKSCPSTDKETLQLLIKAGNFDAIDEMIERKWIKQISIDYSLISHKITPFYFNKWISYFYFKKFILNTPQAFINYIDIRGFDKTSALVLLSRIKSLRKNKKEIEIKLEKR